MTGLIFTPIERVPRISYEVFYREYDLPQKPVIITGAMTNWRAMQEWSHAWFKLRYGTTNVQLSSEATHTKKVASMNLGSYIDSICLGTDQGLYMDQFSFERIPSLTSYIETPYLNPNRRNVQMNLWLGPANTFIGLHKDNHTDFDYINNVFAQICGRKRVVLAAPDQDRLMYPRSKAQGAYWHSQVNWQAPDFERFPLFRDVKLQEATLNPGELLFIPGNYWHSLCALDQSISVSCWWFVHRITDLALSGIRKDKDAALRAESITLTDAVEYGGIDRLCNALQFDGVPAEVRSLLWSMLDTEVRAAIECRRIEMSE